jgi:hypothetical protein
MIQQWNARPIFCASAGSIFFQTQHIFSKCIQNNESPLVIDRNQPHFNAYLTRKRPIAMVDSRRAQQYLRVKKTK